MDEVNIPELVAHLNSPDDAVRKKAAFRLQAPISEPSFADHFESAGGLTALRLLALNATGNTLAYTLASFEKSLELDHGWEYVDHRLIERLVELVVSTPLVNILRGAVAILATVVAKQNDARPQPSASGATDSTFGFQALKPILTHHPTFLDLLVSRLSSGDHVLCANALQLINALMRDAITADTLANEDNQEEWPRFIRRLQDLGVIKSVYNLMQSSSLQDLAHPLYDFQNLTKLLIRKWRKIRVDAEDKDHRRGVKVIHLYSLSEKERLERSQVQHANGSQKHEPNRWQRLGFETDNPFQEFEQFNVGFLGLMDLMDFARSPGPNEGYFHKLLLEKSCQPEESRCPVAKASLAVTAILYDHFEVDAAAGEDGELLDQERYAALESRSNIDGLFKPLLLQWSRLHRASLLAFVRLWEATGALVREDFDKVEELVRILVEHIVGLAARTDDIEMLETRMAGYELKELRALQMELLELTSEDSWGIDLKQVRDELHHEATQFMREQRIRCLLAGTWFPNHNNASALIKSTTTNNQRNSGSISHLPPNSTFLSARTSTETKPGPPLLPLTPLSAAPPTPEMANAPPTSTHTTVATMPWRYVLLSHNRKQLHYGDFATQIPPTPSLESLEHIVQLAQVTKIEHFEPEKSGLSDSDVANGDTPSQDVAKKLTATPKWTITLLGTPKPPEGTQAQSITSPKKTKNRRSLDPDGSGPASTSTAIAEIIPLLTIHPPNKHVFAEWLYGLRVLTTSATSTANAKQVSTQRSSNDRVSEPQTQRLVEFLTRYGVKLRMLNVRFEYDGVMALSGHGAEGGARGKESVVVPSRKGLDEEYFYDVGGVNGVGVTS